MAFHSPTDSHFHIPLVAGAVQVHCQPHWEQFYVQCLAQGHFRHVELEFKLHFSQQFTALFQESLLNFFGKHWNTLDFSAKGRQVEADGKL